MVDRHGGDLAVLADAARSSAPFGGADGQGGDGEHVGELLDGDRHGRPSCRRAGPAGVPVTSMTTGKVGGTRRRARGDDADAPHGSEDVLGGPGRGDRGLQPLLQLAEVAAGHGRVDDPGRGVDDCDAAASRWWPCYPVPVPEPVPVPPEPPGAARPGRVARRIRDAGDRPAIGARRVAPARAAFAAASWLPGAGPLSLRRGEGLGARGAVDLGLRGVDARGGERHGVLEVAVVDGGEHLALGDRVADRDIDRGHGARRGEGGRRWCRRAPWCRRRRRSA